MSYWITVASIPCKAEDEGVGSNIDNFEFTPCASNLSVLERVKARVYKKILKHILQLA